MRGELCPRNGRPEKTAPVYAVNPAHLRYRTQPLWAAFDLRSILVAHDRIDKETYFVGFRSQRKEEFVASDPLLYERDAAAYEEALGAGGLLFYCSGTLDEERRAYTICGWESQVVARAAARMPRHRAAASLAASRYEYHRVETHNVMLHGNGILDITAAPGPHEPYRPSGLAIS